MIPIDDPLWASLSDHEDGRAVTALLRKLAAGADSVSVTCGGCGETRALPKAAIAASARAARHFGEPSSPMAEHARDLGHAALAEQIDGLLALRCDACGAHVLDAADGEGEASLPPLPTETIPEGSDRALVTFMAREHRMSFDAVLAALLDALVEVARAQGAGNPSAKWIGDRLVVRDGARELDIDRLLDAADERIGR